MTDRAEVGRMTEESLRLLADPAQEVLMARRPAFSQLAPVPLLDPGSIESEPSQATGHRRD